MSLSMTPCVYGHAHVSSFPFGRVRALASCRVMHAAVSSQSRFSAPWLTTTCRAYDVSRRRTLTGRRRVHCCASLELTEENVDLVLQEARTELLQLFDESVGITGKVQLVEVDGPTVVLRLAGRFWHQRDMVLARMGAYLKQRIPEILDVDIEDASQLDDSPENF